jgi:hypothetical protein
MAGKANSYLRQRASRVSMQSDRRGHEAYDDREWLQRRSVHRFHRRTAETPSHHAMCEAAGRKWSRQ